MAETVKKTRHLSWPIVAATFFAVSAVTSWCLQSLWDDSKQACEIAAALSYDARSLVGDLDKTGNDPFLKYALSVHEHVERTTFESTLLYAFLSRFSRFHVPSKFRQAAKELGQWREGQDPDEREELLRKVVAETPPEPRCEIEKSAHARIDWFHQRVSQYLGEEAAEDARHFKRAFDEDVHTYCRSIEVFNRLSLTEAARAAACKNPSPQYTQGCRPDSTDAFRKEIADLTEVKKINDRKLQSKWGGGLYGRIHCE
jgi:hypothetical protein